MLKFVLVLVLEKLLKVLWDDGWLRDKEEVAKRECLCGCKACFASFEASTDALRASVAALAETWTDFQADLRDTWRTAHRAEAAVSRKLHKRGGGRLETGKTIGGSGGRETGNQSGGSSAGG